MFHSSEAPVLVALVSIFAIALLIAVEVSVADIAALVGI